MVKRHDRARKRAKASPAATEGGDASRDTSALDAPEPVSRLLRLRRFGLEFGVIVLVFFGLGLWQTRGLLPRGEPLPPFNLVDLEGKQVTLTHYRGKTVLLHFWATWC